MLTPLALFLGAAVLAAVLKSRPQEAAVPVINYPHLTRVLRAIECLPVGELRATPDTIHHHYLEINGLREIRVSWKGQTVERRTFPVQAVDS